MMLFQLACSGSNVMRVIQENILYAQQHAMVVAALAVLSVALWLIRRRLHPIPLGVMFLLVIHPAWTFSATSGDCGYMKANFATLFTVLGLVAVAAQMLAWAWPGSRNRPHNPSQT